LNIAISCTVIEMSAPIFKDFDKAPTDILSDDFDSKYTLKIKSSGPCGVTVTTNTAFEEKEKKLEAKLTVKYGHSSGFTVDKLEISPKGKVATETSLVGAFPGLKLEFKGNDTDKGDLSFTYSASPLATVTGEVDLINFVKASGSVSVLKAPFVGGGDLDFTFGNQRLESTKFGLGFGYSVPSIFAGIKTSNLSSYSGILSYALNKDLTLVGKVSHASVGKTQGFSSVFAGLYKYGPATTLKIKAASTGVINASVKQTFEKKFAVVGSIEIPSGFHTGFKFGVNATLG